LTRWRFEPRLEASGRNRRVKAVDSELLLREIAGYCRNAGMAESTFGRLAVNDGKLVSRLRFGRRVTGATMDRVRSFMSEHPPARAGSVLEANGNGAATASGAVALDPTLGSQRNFRFYDNRQKYLLFVNTCSEKQVVA
jgi:hypothetical protein